MLDEVPFDHQVKRERLETVGSVPELEQRTCACGCGLTFRCTKKSVQKYRSQQCEADLTPGGFTGIGKLKAAEGKRRMEKLNASGRVTTVEIAAHFGVNPVTIYSWAKNGKLRSKADEKGRLSFVLAEATEDIEKSGGIKRRRTKKEMQEANETKDVTSELGPQCTDEPEQTEKIEKIEEPDTADQDSCLGANAEAGERIVIIQDSKPVWEEKIPVVEQHKDLPNVKSIQIEKKDKLKQMFATRLVNRAKLYHDQKSHEAERALLWMAVEEVGLIEGEFTGT